MLSELEFNKKLIKKDEEASREDSEQILIGNE